jgi:hypothetical protein
MLIDMIIEPQASTIKSVFPYSSSSQELQQRSPQLTATPRMLR